jgi:hypothetical protein
VSDPDFEPVEGVSVYTRLIADAYTARGNFYLHQGEYERAIVDYGLALRKQWDTKRHDVCETHPDAYEGRYEAFTCMIWFFRTGGDPNYAGPVLELDAVPDSTREAVRRARVRPGYLVTGDHNILRRYPLTPEGKRDAIAYADELANDFDKRFELDMAYEVETDEFEAVVYEHDGRVREIYRVEPILPDADKSE